MKAKLRDLVKFDGIMTQNVELVSFDWARQLAFFPDGRWVSLANVVIGDPFPPVPPIVSRPGMLMHLGGGGGAVTFAQAQAASGGTVHRCGHCGKVFDGPKAAQSFGGHRRHCKGLPA